MTDLEEEARSLYAWQARVALLTEVRLLRAQRDAVLALHTEYEGHCAHCVKWCDCLDGNPQADINDCPHGNVEWPCPTVAVYATDGEGRADGQDGPCGPNRGLAAPECTEDVGGGLVALSGVADSQVAKRRSPCPVCGVPTNLVSFDRPPRETTWDNAETAANGFRYWAPGPHADVTFGCGCETRDLGKLRGSDPDLGAIPR